MFSLRRLPGFIVLSLMLSACAAPVQNPTMATAAAAPALPASSSSLRRRDATPPGPADSSQVPPVIACLKRGLNSWKIPDNYLVTRDLPDGGQSLALTNPATLHTGLTVEVRPGPERARVTLNENGAVVSAKWRNLIKRCAV